MLFPISDDDRALDGPAYVTWAFLALNIIVFAVFQGLGANEVFTYGWSVIPHEIVNGVDLTSAAVVNIGGDRLTIPQEPGPAPIYLTILSAMFMHGGLMHIGGNLLYLWIFGDNVEHRFGHLPFLGFYLISGIVATIAQIAMDPSSVIPNLGASGAISGVMGAYLVLFPRNRVHAIFFFRVVAIPAVVALGLWIVMQLFSGFGSLGAEQAGGVAYAAHIGGFLAGALMALILRSFIPERETSVFVRSMERDPRTRRLW